MKKLNYIVLVIIGILVLLIVLLLIGKRNNNTNTDSFNSSQSTTLSGHMLISANDLSEDEMNKVYENISLVNPKFGKLTNDNSKITIKGSLFSADLKKNYYNLEINTIGLLIPAYIEDFLDMSFYVTDNEYNVHELNLAYSLYEGSEAYTGSNSEVYEKKNFIFTYNCEEGKIYGYYELKDAGYLTVKVTDSELNKKENIQNFIDLFCENISLSEIDVDTDDEMQNYIKNAFSIRMCKIDNDEFSDIELNDNYHLNLKDDMYLLKWGTVVADDSNVSYNMVEVIPNTYEYKILVKEYSDEVTLDELKQYYSDMNFQDYTYNNTNLTVLTLNYSSQYLETLNGMFSGFLLNIDGRYYLFQLDKENQSPSNDNFDEQIEYIFDKLFEN